MTNSDACLKKKEWTEGLCCGCVVGEMGVRSRLFMGTQSREFTNQK